MRQAELFTDELSAPGSITQLADQAFVLHGYVEPESDLLLEHIESVTAKAAFRHMLTPGGHSMSAAMTNCGDYGWFTDSKGYRYTTSDPASGLAWPKMPVLFQNIAIEAAHAAGFSDFIPQCCLINRYQTDCRMGLHQDKDEQDLTAPIVSVSLGMPAVFLLGGFRRRDPVQTILLHHGDVVVWGGTDRLRYHGVKKILSQPHPQTGDYRFNLTFRQVM